MFTSSRSTQIFFAIAMTISFGANAQGIFPVLDCFGSVTDYFLSRGKLDEKYEQMFNEIASKYGIAHRSIKVRNSGFLLRFIAGYNNALANQPINRVYVNQDWLRELNDEEIKYLMAHELAHHYNNDSLKAAIIDRLTDTAKKYALAKLNPETETIVTRYFTTGIVPSISYWDFMKAQCSQYRETQADTQAVTIAGIDPEAGASLMEKLYNPETKTWPLYARISNVLNRLGNRLYSLPILKQHAPHLPSCKDRIAHILTMKKQR